MTKNLTKREKDVLDCIREYSLQKGLAPSLNDIRVSLGLSSTSTVHEHISRLIGKGYLEKHPHRARSVQIRGQSNPSVKVTTIQDLAGQTDKGLGELKSDEFFQPKTDSVAVMIQGNSMSSEGVIDGDYVIVIPGNGVMDGDAIIGLIDDYKPVIGKLFHLGSKIIIKPICSSRDSTVLDPERIIILGRVKGLVRKI
jgi:repressor LexA